MTHTQRTCWILSIGIDLTDSFQCGILSDWNIYVSCSKSFSTGNIILSDKLLFLFFFFLVHIFFKELLLKMKAFLQYQGTEKHSAQDKMPWKDIFSQAVQNSNFHARAWTLSPPQTPELVSWSRPGEHSAPWNTSVHSHTHSSHFITKTIKKAEFKSWDLLN